MNFQRSTKHKMLYLSGFVAATYLALTTPIFLIIAFITSLFIRVIGIQIGMHRYFTHRSFETTPFKEKFLALLGCLGMEGPPVTWAIIHTHHHKFSDTERDPHSPIHGMLHSAFSWPFKGDQWFKQLDISFINKRLMSSKFHMFLYDNYYLLWATTISIVSLLSINIAAILLSAGVMTSLMSNFFTGWASHANIVGNYRSYDCGDNSYNNKLIQFFSIGEGLHNNHHHYPAKCSQAVRDDEVDPAAWLVKKFFAIEGTIK